MAARNTQGRMASLELLFEMAERCAPIDVI